MERLYIGSTDPKLPRYINPKQVRVGGVWGASDTQYIYYYLSNIFLRYILLIYSKILQLLYI